MTLAAIAAVDNAWGIGKAGKLPWSFPEDLKHFKALTKGGIVIMGRKTYESLPERYRPLPDRTNIVLTKSGYPIKGVVTVGSLNTLKYVLEGTGSAFSSFVIGGGEVYKALLPYCRACYLTRVPGEYGCDAFFPRDELDTWELLGQESFGPKDILTKQVWKNPASLELTP